MIRKTNAKTNDGVAVNTKSNYVNVRNKFIGLERQTLANTMSMYQFVSIFFENRLAVNLYCSNPKRSNNNLIFYSRPGQTG